MKIFKYRLGSLVPQECTVGLPIGWKPLSVGLCPSEGDIVLWAMVTPYGPTEEVRFSVCFTGEEVPYDSKHLGTFTDYVGLVYHVFQLEVESEGS